MYKQKILNEFYEELFCTDFNDYASGTQNLKTDLFCDDENITFENWTEELIKSFCEDCGHEVNEVKEAIQAEPKFLKDLKFEYKDLKSMMP